MRNQSMFQGIKEFTKNGLTLRFEQNWKGSELYKVSRLDDGSWKHEGFVQMRKPTNAKLFEAGEALVLTEVKGEE